VPTNAAAKAATQSTINRLYDIPTGLHVQCALY
jgi:hypothetical protein